jgi:methyl-accepting chemotaxis protein
MQPEVITRVQDSWKKVESIAPVAAALFYHNLFTADPGLQRLFRGDIERQGRRLMQMIGVAVRKLDDLETLVPVLQDLGRRHVRYGVEEAHYQTVGGALLKTLGEGLRREFTPEVEEAWTAVYGVIADVMITAARTAEMPERSVVELAGSGNAA